MIGVERNKILILDGNQRSALAATRALGKKGLCVVVADDMARTLAGSSGYCSERLVYPSPYVNPRGFIDSVKEEVVRRGIGVIFPMTDVTTQLLTQRREEFAGISIPCATREAFEAVTDKWALMELAKQLGVPAPVTRLVRSREDMRDAARQIGFPLVMKTCRSKIQSHDRWVATSVEYACSMQDLERMATSNETFQNYSFLLQERIEGQGQGIFALYDHGNPVAFFAHRRLREKPPSGGVSVLSESVEVDPQLREMSRRILDHVGWHGVAMVEFKVSR
ncbi:MAG: ATP-grasp domain-containing protein, partial [Terriglobia bacterium]